MVDMKSNVKKIMNYRCRRQCDCKLPEGI